jgi:hypothetical protein
VQGLVDHVLVIGAEECDWIAAEATTYYHPELKASEGAGALLLSLKGEGLKFSHSAAQAFHHGNERAQRLREIVRSPDFKRSAVRVTGESGIAILDESEVRAIDEEEKEAAETGAPNTLHPRSVLGESMGAGGALQLVLAASIARENRSAVHVLLPGSLCAAYAAVVGDDLQ